MAKITITLSDEGEGNVRTEFLVDETYTPTTKSAAKAIAGYFIAALESSEHFAITDKKEV